MMLRRVELPAPRDPGPEQSDQGRFDDARPVKEVVAVGDVLPDVNPSADLWQDHQPDVLILEMDRLPGAVHLFIRHAIGAGIRIYPAAAALIDALLEEHRTPFRWLLGVRRDDHLVVPGADPAHLAACDDRTMAGVCQGAAARV